MYRIPNSKNWPADFVNQIINDDAVSVLKRLPDECIALAVTSPPYWDVVDYSVDGQIGQSSYEKYIQDLLAVWAATERVLIPNGKLAIVAPIMPIPKSVIGDQHTRHLKNISADIDYSILSNIPTLNRFSLFIWQKQTTTKMFGSYPYPPNLYEDNTIEFISVFVKDGPPPNIPKDAKEASKISQAEWLNLTAQVWPMYPEDVTRSGGHPAPFPVVLPQRLILMYTFQRSEEQNFAGDIVLDMFNGSGSTCLAAKATNRNYIGIDLNPDYCEFARQRVKYDYVDAHQIMLERVSVKAPANSQHGQQLQLFADESE